MQAEVEDDFCERVIAEATDPSAPKSEQMAQVARWVTGHSRYFACAGTCFFTHGDGGSRRTLDLTLGQLATLDSITTSGLQYDRLGYLLLDSSTSPALLCAFGERLGYPLENWFGKYPYGSYLWEQNHFYAYSAADGLLFMADNAPLTKQEEAAIPEFDPATWDGFVDLE